MARPISTLTVPSIAQPREYPILRRDNKDILKADITCNEMILDLLRSCLQRAADPTSTALQTRNMNSVGEGRIFWNSVADLITSSSFFPITINVPDMFSAMGQFITQLPIINRIYLYLTQESTPRKKKKKKKPAQGHAHPGKTTTTSNRRPFKTRRVKVNTNRNRQ